MSNLLKDLGLLLTEHQIQEAANNLGVGLAHLRTILKVETGRYGFYPSTMIPVVRFENHKFGEYTGYQYNTSKPYLSSTKFTNQYNKTGLNEYKRFEEAYSLDGLAAVRATSWGIGQIMGSNWESIGYTTLNFFLKDAFESEATQLRMMSMYLKSRKGLVEAIKTEDWQTVARLYNGANYAQNKYDVKLQQAFYELKEH